MQRLRRMLASVGVAVLLGAAATSVPASAAEEHYPAPAVGYWDVGGRGWGHGVGMSQYGALAAAQDGLSAEQILDFYYPGTARHDVGNPTIRVQLRALAGTPNATFWNPPGQPFRIGAPGSASAYAEGRYTVTLGAAGFTVQRRDVPGGPVTATFQVPGDQLSVTTPAGAAVAQSAGPVTGSWYRGELRLVRTSATTFDVVNHVSLQNYLYGVVPREMLASWPHEALRAQAVAARTYALAVQQPTASYDICDTTQCQVYGGRAQVSADWQVTPGEAATSNAAVDTTDGDVRWYGGRAAFTQFSSNNGGYSVQGRAFGQQVPYLPARPDPYTGTASGDRRTTWQDRLQVSTVARQCPPGGSLQTLVVTGRDGHGPLGGRITGARVECSTGSATITAESVLRFGMFSSWWQPLEPRFGFFLSSSFSATADTVFIYGRPDDDARAGDWNGDGIDTMALRRGNLYHIRQSNTTGPADQVVAYGRADDTVLVGDWDGDGTDTLAVRRANAYHIKNSMSSGVADQVVFYGRPGDQVVVGDWDGDGRDTLAVRRGNAYHITNSMSSGVADQVVFYGRADDTILVGDWDGDGTDTLAVRRANAYHIKNSMSSGVADRVVFYGRTDDVVLVGDWDADGVDTLGLHRRP